MQNRKFMIFGAASCYSVNKTDTAIPSQTASTPAVIPTKAVGFLTSLFDLVTPPKPLTPKQAVTFGEGYCFGKTRKLD